MIRALPRIAGLVAAATGLALTVSTARALPPGQAATAAAAVPTPAQIVAAAPASDWQAIAPDDLLVMDLAPGASGPRRVVIQLIGPQFARAWVENIRELARAHWWDGTSVNRVQDNYVAQWGDPNGDDKAKAKPVPPGLAVVNERAYTVAQTTAPDFVNPAPDAYAAHTGIAGGFGVAFDGRRIWPVHCYGSVGVARNLSPDTGTGAELYAVIGHAPRPLDRNIAVVGRVIEGIENLSSLPRGPAPLGVYSDLAMRVPIRSIRLASDMPGADRLRFEMLKAGSASFARYARLRANRHDAFFIQPAGGADICNLPVPVRRVPGRR
jgi:peptidylprolyl isomerase